MIYSSLFELGALKADYLFGCINKTNFTNDKGNEKALNSQN